jgi:hypothetical protein
MEDCEMFSCMVSQCWCKDSLTNGILSQSNAQVQSEEDAEAVVANYLTSNSIAYESGTVHAVNLNVIFYNVFYTNQSGNENMLTVAVDGTIMETECGV